MSTITTQLATADRFDDLQHALSGGGDGASCQCIWPMIRSRDWQASTREQREGMLRTEIEHAPVPGIIAYVDDEPAGWIRIGRRRSQLRIMHTRAITAATAEPPEADDVWAVTCFVVRRAHRGIGLNAVLLRAAIEHAREQGARVIEAYPVDPAGDRRRDNDMFHGLVSTFLAAGFRQTGELKPGRPLVTLAL